MKVFGSAAYCLRHHGFPKGFHNSCLGDQVDILNSPHTCATNMRLWIGSAWVKITPCRLFCTKPLSNKPMLCYGWLEQTEFFSSEYRTCNLWKCFWKYRLRKAAMLSRVRWVKSQYVTPSGSVTGIFRDYEVNIVAVDIMKSCGNRSSTTMVLTHWSRDKMDAISQTTFSNAFSWMKMFEYRSKFHWSLFLRVQLTISQHWFR